MYVKIKIITQEDISLIAWRGNVKNHFEHSFHRTWKMRVYGNYA
jgi:hypothetical protein